LIVALLAAIGFGIWYYLTHHKEKEGEYLWVGEGPDPFKKRK
jgi:hypothetical protein